MKPSVPVFEKYPKTILLNDTSDKADGEVGGQKEDQPFSQADFKKVWRDYADSIKDKRPRLSLLMSEQIPELQENSLTVSFFADSQVQRDWLDKNVRVNLEEFLQRNLHNSGILLRFEMKDEAQTEEGGESLYTAQEKFNYMLEKSEALRYMREVFGLKTD